jgi:Glycosyl transferase family 2
VRMTVIVPATDRPETLPAALAGIFAAAGPPDEVIVVDTAPAPGPAAARNAGVQRAAGDLLVFVDADIEIRPDAFVRIREAFAADPRLTAVFGSYDDDPAAPGVVSGFRNLLHHHVHHRNAGLASTFWVGLGAIRRDALIACGGFDENRYRHPSIEDIELGSRLVASGARIRLDPEIQGKHLKAWTVGTMAHTDLFRRGAPWVELLLRQRRPSAALNLGWRERMSSGAMLGLACSLARRRGAGIGGASVVFLFLNAEFYMLLLRRRGVRAALAGPPLHALHHLAAVASVPVGALLHAREVVARTAVERPVIPAPPAPAAIPCVVPEPSEPALALA